MKLGFLGTGTMGGALAEAAAGSALAGELLLVNRSREKAEKLAAKLGDRARVCTAAEAAEESDFLFLGVKPQMMEGLLSEIAPVLGARKDAPVLVTMAAGLTIDAIRRMAGGEYPVIRIMPNTPAAIGEGMILYDTGKDIPEEKTEEFLEVMKHAGRFSRLPESLIDAGSAVSGCGPAFACMFAEALADGGVACGLPRKQALEFACQMLVGTAKLILESGDHPGKLKDAVCSPGGTTIQGVRTLEESGFRGAVMDAVIAAYEKAGELKR